MGLFSKFKRKRVSKVPSSNVSALEHMLSYNGNTRDMDAQSAMLHADIQTDYRRLREQDIFQYNLYTYRTGIDPILPGEGIYSQIQRASRILYKTKHKYNTRAKILRICDV